MTLRASGIRVEAGTICVGDRFRVTLQRTLRIPDDGRDYPLPPGFGALPVHRVSEFRSQVPEVWDDGGFLVPMYQREALWLQFEAARWKPNAVKVGLGEIDAISGENWSSVLRADPQNYVVCPRQPWLDGINAGAGFIRQFVATTPGSGDTVEEQLTGSASAVGLRVLVFDPKPGRFPDVAPPRGAAPSSAMTFVTPGLGISAGGRMKQNIYPDPYGLETWDQTERSEVFVYIVNSAQYRSITELEPPPSPISAEQYTAMGLPWFTLYDEPPGDIPPAEKLVGVKSLDEREAARGAAEATGSVDVQQDQIWPLKHKSKPDQEK